MDLGIRNRVALVAASSRGLGKAVAEALAAEGVRLALCARDAGVLGETAGRIREAYRVPVFEQAVDVTDPDAVKKFVDAAIERYGTVDIGVANAGGPPAKTFAQTSVEDWRKAFDLNFLSTLYLARELLPLMQRQKWGRFIAIASVTVKQPADGLILSNAIRAGVVGLMKSLANEYGRDNILFHTVCPGFTATDRLYEVAGAQAAAEGATRDDILSRWTRNIPLGRLARPDEFAALVAFLCSERAGYMTGTNIAVDGGLVKGIS